jgi:YD repeat-containing protein
VPFRRRALVAALLSAAFVAELPGSMAGATSPVRAKSRTTIAYDGYATPPTQIQVKQSPRIKPSFDARIITRPKVVRAIRPFNGRRVAGPPLLRPDQIDAAVRAAQQRRTAPAHQQPLSVGPIGAAPRSQGSVPMRGSATSGAAGTRTVQSLPNNPSGSGTGINPWWRYQEENVPGGGHVMVNVGTGNLVLQEDDMGVPHKGIALAFRRTYNSQSLHDVYGNDGFAGMYGNGWTSTFDAHLTGTSSAINVWDIDGAEYTYTFASGTWQAPAGQHATLTSDGACGFLWTKKTGTTYYFWAPYQPSTCTTSYTTDGGYAGRLSQIIGRNRNVTLTFAYSWDNGIATSAGKISDIVVTTESGLTASLAFADVNGYRLLQTLTFPDNSTYVAYGYDNDGDLITISHPPNNTAGTRPTQLLNYQRVGANLLINFEASPLTDAACNTSGGCYSNGGGLLFSFAGATAPTSTVTAIQEAGLVNPTIPDGTNAGPIQGTGYATYVYTYNTEYFTTGVTTPTFSDTDGHMTTWMFDTAGRPIKTQECTASSGQGTLCTGTWLVTDETWDGNNNLVSEMDPRGYTTNYAYDGNGNAIAEAAPQVSTSQGSFRPTKLYSYDAFNNVTAYCDEVATNQLGKNWTASGPTVSDSLCPSSSTAAQFVFVYPSYEPYGELSHMVSPATASAPNGYQRTYSYAAAQQGGVDYGLPTSEVGTAITQLDGTSRQPTQSFWYDGNGDLACYSKGPGYWVLSYDSLDRLVSTADPDDSAAGSGICGKTGGQSGWSTAETMSYYPDGALQSKQTASQRALGVVDTLTYDLDGNEASETHHYGCASTSSCTAGVTSKWYDGADRLVEVQQPYDGWDVQAYPWSTRYFYDLSEGRTTPYRSLSLRAYGGLVVTQELLSGTVWTPTFGTTYAISTGSWTPVRASSFDALDRGLNAYEAALGDQPKESRTYDGSGNAGLLSSDTLATGESKSYTYDARNEKTAVSYSGDGGVTPALAFAYDADGRQAVRSTSVLGAESLTYDLAGELLSVAEPSTLGGGTISYSYYADGMRSVLGYSDPTQSYPAVASHSYRPDGLEQQLKLSNGTAFRWTYTNAGREQSEVDPFTGTSITPTAVAVVKEGKTYQSLPRYPSPLTYSARTEAYDSYGRIASIVLPASMTYAYPTGSYDLEDGPIAESRTFYFSSPLVPPPTVSTYVQCLPSNVRNEKLIGAANGFTITSPSQCASVAAPYPVELNGALIGAPVAPGPPIGVVWELDARDGMLLRTQATDTYGNVSYASNTYDLSGRLTNNTELVEPNENGGCPQDGLQPTQYPGFVCYYSGIRTKAYDAENRLRSEIVNIGGPNNSWSSMPLTLSLPSVSDTEVDTKTCAWCNTSVGFYPSTLSSIDYSATDHPERFALQSNGMNVSPSEAWLWDGSDRLLACTLSNSQCTTPVFSLGGIADFDVVHNYVTVNDRNRDGLISDRHSSTGFGPWMDTGGAQNSNVMPQPIALCSDGDAPAGPDSNGDPVCFGISDGKQTADGWIHDLENWQGVRTFDTTIGQWNTPDAYAGDVHDPMSQKPYMWNNNNPYEYSDPSGFNPGCHTLFCGDSTDLAMGTDDGLDLDQQNRLPSFEIAQAKSSPPPTPQQASEELKKFNVLNIGDGRDFLPTLLTLLGLISPETKAADIFAEGGTLSARAISGSSLIIDEGKLGNPAIPAGVAKYSTETFGANGRRWQVHFYMNPVTQKVYYGLDYKAVMVSGSTW